MGSGEGMGERDYTQSVTTHTDGSSAQRTRVLTTRREYARRLVPDRFRLPPRTHGPTDIRAISTVSTFKQHLKTHLFNIAYFYKFSLSLVSPFFLVIFYITCYVHCTIL